MFNCTSKVFAQSCITAETNTDGVVLSYKVNAGASCTSQISLNNTLTELPGKCSNNGECILSQVNISDCISFYNPNNSQGTFQISSNESCMISTTNNGTTISIPGMCSKNLGACVPNNPCLTFDGNNKYTINPGANCYLFESGTALNGSCNFEGRCIKY